MAWLYPEVLGYLSWPVTAPEGVRRRIHPAWPMFQGHRAQAPSVTSSALISRVQRPLCFLPLLLLTRAEELGSSTLTFGLESTGKQQ